MRDSDRQKLQALNELMRVRRMEESNALSRMAESQRSCESARGRVEEVRQQRQKLIESNPISAEEIRDRRFLDALLDREKRFEEQVTMLETLRDDQRRRFEFARARAEVAETLRKRQLEQFEIDSRQMENRQVEDLHNSRTSLPSPSQESVRGSSGEGAPS